MARVGERMARAGKHLAMRGSVTVATVVIVVTVVTVVTAVTVVIAITVVTSVTAVTVVTADFPHGPLCKT
jgi:hypothetical protein